MRRCEDEKMWRCEDVKMRRCEEEKMWGWEDVWEDVKMWRWEDVKMWGCEDERMWRWEDVKMWRCEDEKMWRCEDVKMGRCEDEKMWRGEDVLQTPTIGRTLRSNALGKNYLPCLVIGGVSIRRKGLYGQSGSKQRTHMYKQVCGMADDQSIALEIETKEPVWTSVWKFWPSGVILTVQ